MHVQEISEMVIIISLKSFRFGDFILTWTPNISVGWSNISHMLVSFAYFVIRSLYKGNMT
jgi:hypothetical protein